jgi:hypothetical protein
MYMQLTIFILILFSIQPAIAEPVNGMKASLLEARGDTLEIALKPLVEEGWHLYWKVAGDSGLPPELELNLDGSAELLELSWPAPRRQETEAGTSFLLPDDSAWILTVLVSQREAEALLDCCLSWLACKEACVAGKESLQLDLNRLEPATRKEAKRLRHLLPESCQEALPFVLAGETLRVDLPGRLLGFWERPAWVVLDEGFETDSQSPLIVSRRGDSLVLKQKLAAWSNFDTQSARMLLVTHGWGRKARDFQITLKKGD